MTVAVTVTVKAGRQIRSVTHCVTESDAARISGCVGRDNGSANEDVTELL